MLKAYDTFYINALIAVIFIYSNTVVVVVVVVVVAAGFTSQPGLQYPQCPPPPTCLFFESVRVEHQYSPFGSCITKTLIIFNVIKCQ